MTLSAVSCHVQSRQTSAQKIQKRHMIIFVSYCSPFYSKDKLLMRYGQFMNHIDDYFYTENQNEFKNWPTHEMFGEWHCQFYHCLYDHTDLNWDEILTIDRMDGKLRSYYDYTPIDLCLEKLECSEREEYVSDANKDQWEQIEKINKALAIKIF